VVVEQVILHVTQRVWLEQLIPVEVEVEEVEEFMLLKAVAQVVAEVVQEL
jgi:hypothetical protein